MLRSAYPPGGTPSISLIPPWRLNAYLGGRPTKSVIYAALGLPPGANALRVGDHLLMRLD